MTTASFRPSSLSTDHATPLAEGFADVLVGLQYGDEGKAKIIDALAPGYDVIARFNGGANAGHTIDTPQGRIALKQLPSGVFHPHATLYIGSGCAINPWKLAEEIEQVRKMGVSLEGRLHISARAALVQPHHIAMDRRGGDTIGTTGNGIGPCYADRALRVRNDTRVNLMLGDLLGNEAETVPSPSNVRCATSSKSARHPVVDGWCWARCSPRTSTKRCSIPPPVTSICRRLTR